MHFAPPPPNIALGANLRPWFGLDERTVYLDNASVGPLPLAVEAVAHRAISTKAKPWSRDREAARAKAATLRRLAADLIGAEAKDMAITCAASYGLAVARKTLPVRAGDKILTLQDDHTSQSLTWEAHARRMGAEIDAIPRPRDGNWTREILSHLDHSKPPAIAALCATFWRDGTQIDLAAICARLHAAKSGIVLDLTQSVGVLDFDVKELRADFVVFPMYKWLLGPYSLAFLYVAPHWQDGDPLEENVFNREMSGDYSIGAGRFDMGEKDTFVSIPTSIAALEFLSVLDRATIRKHVSGLSRLLSARLYKAGIQTTADHLRSPHIVGVYDMPEGTGAECRRRNVFLTQRGNEVRVAPHVFNTEEDIERCAAALIELCQH